MVHMFHDWCHTVKGIVDTEYFYDSIKFPSNIVKLLFLPPNDYYYNISSI